LRADEILLNRVTTRFSETTTHQANTA